MIFKTLLSYKYFLIQLILPLALALTTTLTTSCSNESDDGKSGTSGKKSAVKIPTAENSDQTSSGIDTTQSDISTDLSTSLSNNLSTDPSNIPLSAIPQDQSVVGFNPGKMYQCVNNTDCVIFIGEDPSSGEERPVAIAKTYLSTIHYQIASQTKTEYEGFTAICEYQTCRLKPTTPGTY